MSLDADIKDFVHDHHPHGHLTADATEPVWNGYLLTVACPCGVVFRRWVTPEDAELDLNRFSGASSGWRGIRHDREGRNNVRNETMSPNRKSRIKLFRNPLTALALVYAVVLLGCAPEGTTKILSYHGFVAGGGGPGGPRHPGVDFAALVGDPVIAAADGVVVQAGFGWGCGNGVSIELRAQEAPLGWTLYCHFTEINVREGQTVKRGDVLGTAGTSGQTGGVPHVHFGLCPNK